MVLRLVMVYSPLKVPTAAPLSQLTETMALPSSSVISAMPLMVPMPVARSQAAFSRRSPAETIEARPEILPMSRTSLPSPRAVRLTFPMVTEASPREEPRHRTLMPLADIS